MTLTSDRAARFLLSDTSGRATLLGVLVTLLLTYGFLMLFSVQRASANLGNISTTKSCIASGCHNSPSTSGKGYIGVAVNGVAQTLNASHTAPAVNVAPGDSFQIDWVYANMQGGSSGSYVDDNPLIAVPGTSAGGTLWTIAPGTADNPGTITLYDNTATPATMTYAWDSIHWNGAGTVSSTTAATKGGASNIAGWNTYIEDSNFGTTGPGAISMTGYTINYPTSGGDPYIWGSANNLATDDASTNDRDGTKGRMGVDARITVPAGTPTGTYNVYVYGVGHDANNSGSKSYIMATIPVNVVPVISSTSPLSIAQGSAQSTLTINGSGFTGTGLSVAINDANITLGAASYVNASQITVPITVTSSASVGSKNLTVTCSGVTSPAFTGFSVTAGLTATTTTVSSPAAITYGQSTSFTATVSPSAATGTVQFKVDGVNQGSPVTVSGGTATLSNVTGLTAGSRSVTAVYSGDASYATSTSTVVAQVVNKATPTLSITNSPVTYDGTAKSANVSASIAGTVGSVLTGGAASQTIAGTYAVTANFTPTDTTNYNSLTGASAGNFVINKADQTISFSPAAVTKTYGDADFSASASTSSPLEVTYTSDTSAVATVNATSGLVHIAGAGSDIITANLAGDANYNPASAQLTLTVNKAPLTVSAQNASRPYGTDNPAFVPLYSGFVNGETAAVLTGSPDLTTTADINSPAGSYPITASAGTLAAADYSFTFGSGTLAIDLASQTITFNPLANKTYGDAPFALTATGGASGNPVTFTSSDPNVATITDSTVTIVGAGIATITANQAGTTNYASATTQQNLVVDKALLNVSAQNANRSYNTANPIFTPVYSGFVNGETTAVLTGTPDLFTTATQASPVGSYPITVSIGTLAAANYTFTFGTGTLGIDVAIQSITFDPLAGKTYGNAPFDLTATGGASGFPVTFTSSNTAVATVTGTTVTIVGAGTTTITANQSGDSNYAAATAQQSLTVSKAQLTVTAQPASRVYGEANPALSPDYSGFVNSETVAVLQGSPDLSTTADASSPVASYPISVASGNLFANNYSFNFTPGSLTVTKAQLTVTANNASRAYGAGDPIFIISYSGFVNGENQSVISGSPDITSNATAASPAGVYSINPSSGTLSAANYSFTMQPGTLTVTMILPTVTTAAVTPLSQNSASGGGDITSDGGGSVSGGVCWNLSGLPTLADSCQSGASGVGSFTVSLGGLTSGTTYYARAYATNSAGTAYGSDTSFTTQSGNATLAVTLLGAGGGSVNSSPAAIACTSGSSTDCSKSFANGTPVTLTATPDWKSIFTGWGVPCSGSGSCLITLDGDAGVSATFAVNGQATVLGHFVTEYGSLQDAYNAANNGSIVAAHVYTFIENLTLDRAIAVTLDMGKGDLYLSAAGYSTLQGSLTIGQGSATIKNLIIK